MNLRENQVTVQKPDREQVTYDPSRLRGITAYREIEREFAIGDRLQFTAPNRELGVANRELGTIEQIYKDGQLTVRLDNERTISFDPRQMRHFDHGYAVTSHSSQGLTAERVLVNIDSNVHPELINTRFAYVSVSRASHDAHIYTDDAASLGKNLSHDVTKSSAVNSKIKKQATKEPIMEPRHGLRDLDSFFDEARFRQRIADLDIPINNLPASMYAAQLPHEVIQQDIRTIQWGISQDVSRQNVDVNVIVEHWRRDGEHVPMVAFMYVVELQESVRKHPDFTPEQHIAALQPTVTDRQQWEPLAKAVNLETADRFHWVGENGTVQSYKHSGTGKYLHIDGASGQFYDRDKNPIGREAAIEHALSTGRSQAVSQELRDISQGLSH